MKIVALLVRAAFVCGCSIPHSVKEGGAVSGHTVDPTGKVLLLNVADGQEQGQPPANGSGRGMVEALRKVLSTHNIPLTTSDSLALSSGLEEAQKSGYDYVVKCTITLWEDNATAWSGNGDKLNIAVDLYDAKSHQLLAAATHKRTATGATWVAGSPDRFMDEVATGALGQIYGWPQKK